jgi:hypothetical protein
MDGSFKNFFSNRVAPADGFVVAYTVGADQEAVLKCIDIANLNNVEAFMSVYLDRNSSGAVPANVLIPMAKVPPAGSYQWSGTQVLEPGDVIYVAATTAAATVHICGFVQEL